MQAVAFACRYLHKYPCFPDLLVYGYLLHAIDYTCMLELLYVIN